ncbi:MAG: CHAT domain-containing protein [Candidatus Omnitrophica bacterium]|nr:CHAT domain-containing protein [Candidatus Omnitrophota bacterium]MDD5661144.1 CHAT domain-containing protein [Candidatus Omnitrophota bacterium]
MPQVETLILEVFKQNDCLKMGLFDQGQTLPTLRHYSQVGVSFDELKQLSAELVAVLNWPANDNVSKFEQLKSLQKIGQLFWNHLFSRSIKENLKNSPPAVLTLCLDEELIYIPWELIFDGSDFLCLKFSVGRLVRSKGEATLLQYRDLSDSLRMLILANPSADLKSAYSEGLNIKNQFNHMAKKVYVDFKSTNIEKNYVKKNICDYDIVHFAGHCEFDKRDSKNSGWVLSDGIFKVEDILKMGHSLNFPALIFSNACHSAQVYPRSITAANSAALKGLIDAEYQRANYGMASAFLFAGVRHYIGSIRKIEDKASHVFAREFYLKLISGISVGESLRLSKLKLVKEFGLDSLHWVNYLLYGDPSFVFFRIHQRKEKKKFGVIYKKFKLKVGLAVILIFLSVFFIFLFPRINPGKLFHFLNSQAAYRKGNNQAAIALSKRVISLDQNFLAAYPVIADAYQRLGDKEKAKKYYFEYVLKSERLNNKNHLTEAYIKLGWFYHLDGKYPKAEELYNKAVSLSRQLKNKKNEAVALRKLAVWHIDNSNYGQALDLLTKSAAINLEHPNNFENTKNLACDYFDIGLVFANKNDYPAAKDFYVRSMKIFERLNLKNELSDCYFNLGEIYLFEKEYQKASEYYFKGLRIDEGQDNKVGLACDYNMIGELYLEMEDLPIAEDYFKKSFILSSQINSQPDMVNAGYNLGLLYKKQGRKNLAREYWRKAQEISRLVDPEMYQEIRRELKEIDTI